MDIKDIRDKQIRDALMMAADRASRGRKKDAPKEKPMPKDLETFYNPEAGSRIKDGILEPGDYGPNYGADVKNWREKRGAYGREKGYNPWADPENMYTHPSEERHDPNDPIYNVSPEEYRKGAYGRGVYALRNGGRANMATGGDPTSNYISSLYQNIMGREADVGGAEYWKQQLEEGNITPSDILYNFAQSPEFKNVYQSDPSKAVSSLYQAALGRSPDQGGLDYWNQQVKSGLGLGDLVSGFTGSEEGRSYQSYKFPGLYNINDSVADQDRKYSERLVADLYHSILGREPDREGFNFWTRQMIDGKQSYDDVANALFDLPEAKENFVNQTYKQFLGREPDAEGKKYFTQALQSGQATPDQIYEIIQNSEEAGDFEISNFIQDQYKGLTGRDPSRQELNSALDQLKSGAVTFDQFHSNMFNSPESQQYQASNFEPYQVASAEGSVTVAPKQLRTAYEYSKANDELIRSLPIEQQVGALLQQEGGIWVDKILNPNTPKEIKDQALKQLEGIVNVVANRAAVGLTENSGGKKSPWRGWFDRQENDPKSVTSQILAPSAFSAMKIGVSKLAKEGYNAIVNKAIPNFNKEEYQPIIDMIKGVLSGQRPDITQGATHYKANYVHPGWAKRLPLHTDLGGAPGGKGPYHQFYGAKDRAAEAQQARFGVSYGGADVDPALAGAGAGVTGGGSGTGYIPGGGSGYVPGGGGISGPADVSGAGGDYTGGHGGGGTGHVGVGTGHGGIHGGTHTGTPHVTGGVHTAGHGTTYTGGHGGPHLTGGVSYLDSSGYHPGGDFGSYAGSHGFGHTTVGHGGHHGSHVSPYHGWSWDMFHSQNPYGIHHSFKNGGAVKDALRLARASGGGAWTRKEGKNPEGGLNEKGRASLRAQGHDIKRPQPEGGSRRDSFCARMKGMKAKLTSAETANDPDSRINKSLRKWNCADGGAIDDALMLARKSGGEVWNKPRPKSLGKPEKLTSKEKASAKRMAKAAGRPYPNLVDNMRAAKADGGSIDDALRIAKRAK
jgi:hypothetical protein